MGDSRQNRTQRRVAYSGVRITRGGGGGGGGLGNIGNNMDRIPGTWADASSAVDRA